MTTIDTVSGTLRRALTLPMVVLYGLGVTIGAGIYVLIGEAAARAGTLAPWAFVLAAIVMAPTALSFAELATRMPVAAGEAAYIGRAFGSRALAILFGLLVVAVGIVSAAAISLGSVDYMQLFLDWPRSVLVPMIVLMMGAVASWGIKEAVGFAAVMTVIEIGGLALIVAAGLAMAVAGAGPESVAAPSPASTAGSPVAGVLSASVLAFFAFVGFESIVNVAEETHEPQKTLPRAIVITLCTATLIYVLVGVAALACVSAVELGRTPAPLALVFERSTGLSPRYFATIAIVATLNGIIVQIVMASRVLYGLADQGQLPRLFGYVNPRTQTPTVATAVISLAVLFFAIALPLEPLAELTSQVSLVIFTGVNAALLRLKLSSEPKSPGALTVPLVIPVLGIAGSLAMLATSFLA